MVDDAPKYGQLTNRLKDLIESNWPSVRAAADDLGCPKSSLDRYMKGAEPPNDLLRRLGERLNLPLNYVFAFDDNPAFAPAAGRRRPDMELVFVPRLDVRAAAGPGSENEHLAVEEHLSFPHWMLRKLGVHGRAAKLRVIRAKGDSMETTFSDGALLLVDESDIAPPQKASPRRHDRDIFVFLLDGALRTKRLRQRGTELLVLSDNRDYDIEILRGAELKRVKIIGRVVWWDDRL